MPSPLIVAVGMPRAGSGWHYNLVHDLVVATGGVDARAIRRRFLLHRILTEVNCNIGAFTPNRLLPVMVPSLCNKTYVVKAHAGPTRLCLWLVKIGMILPLYIYRDPRDALLSAYEYGGRKRDAGREGAFADLDSIESAIEFMKEYVAISKSWLSCQQAHHTRYEDLLSNYAVETNQILDFLGLDCQVEAVKAIIQKYQPEKGRADQRGTHFVKGMSGRYRKKLSDKQQELCIDAFGDYLKRMGYPIP
jgi:hypothetical protein